MGVVPGFVDLRPFEGFTWLEAGFAVVDPVAEGRDVRAGRLVPV